jgi:hypothetical protein
MRFICNITDLLSLVKEEIDCNYPEKIEKYFFYGLSYSTKAVKELDCFRIPQVSQ